MDQLALSDIDCVFGAELPTPDGDVAVLLQAELDNECGGIKVSRCMPLSHVMVHSPAICSGKRWRVSPVTYAPSASSGYGGLPVEFATLDNADGSC